MGASSCYWLGSSREGCTSSGAVSRRGLPGCAMLLRAENITKSFGNFRAVAGASLAIAQGEIVGLIGPNGAGKSTFFNCLSGDMTPDAGRVVFKEADLTQ